MIQLFDYRRPADERFYPLPRPRMFLGPRDLHAPGEGGRTPMPAPWEISSSTPAWDPSSSTPLGAGASSSSVPANAPSASSSPGHILLDPCLENIKVAAKVTGAEHANKSMTVWGTVIDGRRRIVYSSNKALKDITMAQVILDVPNPTRTDSLLVVVNGENIGTFVRRVTHERNGTTSLAVCRVVTRKTDCRDTVTTTTLKLRAEDVALVAETKEEKVLNKGILAEERAAARIRA